MMANQITALGTRTVLNFATMDGMTNRALTLFIISVRDLKVGPGVAVLFLLFAILIIFALIKYH